MGHDTTLPLASKWFADKSSLPLTFDDCYKYIHGLVELYYNCFMGIYITSNTVLSKTLMMVVSKLYVVIMQYLQFDSSFYPFNIK